MIWCWGGSSCIFHVSISLFSAFFPLRQPSSLIIFFAERPVFYEPKDLDIKEKLKVGKSHKYGSNSITHIHSKVWKSFNRKMDRFWITFGSLVEVTDKNGDRREQYLIIWSKNGALQFSQTLDEQIWNDLELKLPTSENHFYDQRTKKIVTICGKLKLQ